jgi:hypothetical protein
MTVYRLEKEPIITDLINSAFIFYFENRKIAFDPKEDLKQFIQSSESEEYVTKLLEKDVRKRNENFSRIHTKFFLISVNLY